jgi:hypothetical protein
LFAPGNPVFRQLQVSVLVKAAHSQLRLIGSLISLN